MPSSQMIYSNPFSKRNFQRTNFPTASLELHTPMKTGFQEGYDDVIYEWYSNQEKGDIV